MFFRRSPRRRHRSGLGSFVNSARTRWSHSDVDRKFSFKRGYSRRLGIESLEDRHLLAAVTVSNISDVVDGDTTSIANLIGTPGADGTISLREAILAANTDAVADTITFDASLNGEQILLDTTNGQLTITNALSIDASALPLGIIVNGNDPSAATGNGIRVLNIDNGAAGLIAVSLNNLTITGGDPASDQQGGGIRSLENLTIINSRIQGNKAGQPGMGIVQSGGSITINQSSISQNTGATAGLRVINATTVSITDSTINGNIASAAGFVFGGALISDSGTVTITRSTFSGNQSGGDGGGLGLLDNTTTTIINSTISGNVAIGDGGGLFADVNAGQTFAIRHSTITDNTSNFGSGGGIFFDSGTGTVTLAHTIVAGNADNSATGAEDIDNTTAGGNPVISSEFNFIGVDTGHTIANGAAGNQVGTAAAPLDPLLGPLANNGGFTLTHLPQLFSPVVDAGENPVTPAAPATDQRGLPRIVDGDFVAGAIIDIGAVELAAPPQTIQVDLVGPAGAEWVHITDLFNNAGGTDNDIVLSIEGTELVVTSRNGTILVVPPGVTQNPAALNQARISLALITGQRVVADLLNGNDALTVDSTGGLVAFANGIQYNAGAGFDRLTITQDGGVANPTAETLIGALPGTGRDLVTGAGGQVQRVDFFDIEPIDRNGAEVTWTIRDDPALVALGIASILQESNAINYTQGKDATWGRITIDNFEPIEFKNKQNVVLHAGAGSDLVNLNNPSIPTGLTGTFTVNAGDPTAGSDTVVVNDVDSTTNIVVSAIGADSATIVGAQPVGVIVTGTELLIIDGQGGSAAADQDVLEIQGAANSERFVHTPGNTRDSGRFDIFDETAARALLPIEYRDLGSRGIVTVTGGDQPNLGGDTLVARGTAGADTMNVAFTAIGAPDVDLTTTLGVHVDLRGTGIENLVVETLADNDTIIAAAPILLTAAAPPNVLAGTFKVIGGDSDADTDKFILVGQAATVEAVIVRPDFNVPTDQEVVVTANAVTTVTDITGVELIQYNGVGGDDTLTVDFRAVNAAGTPVGTGVVDARVQNAADGTDQVLSNRMPEVRVSGVAGATLGGSTQPTTATFLPKQLATGWHFASRNPNDTFVIEGTGGIDVVTASRGADISVATAGGATVTAGGMTETDLFKVVSLGGDDILIVDSPAGPITTPILYDGGADRDTLVVRNVPGVDEVIYTPGLLPDHGRLFYENAANARLMSIDFENLEPVIDLVVAPNLTIHGTPAANSITYRQGSVAANGLVTVDDFETIEFSNKANLTINGLEGDDIIVANNPNTPTGLVTLTFNGGLGNDEIRIENLPAVVGGNPFTGATVNGGDGNDIIDAFLNPNATPLELNGDAGNDWIRGGVGNDEITGGTGNDTIVVSPSLAAPGTDTIDGNEGDNQLQILGTADANTVVVTQNAAANSMTVTVDGVEGNLTRANIQSLRIELGDSNDQLTINLPNAQLIDALPIFYDGGTGSDVLLVQGNFGGGNGVDRVTYTPGLQVDEGRLVYEEGPVGAPTQRMDIKFDNLEPIVDLVAAVILVVNGTPASNVISYTVGPNSGLTNAVNPTGLATGLVSVDNFETVEFANKTVVRVDALAGDDLMVYDLPTAAAGLSSLRFNGGEGNDTVRLESMPAAGVNAIVNGNNGNDTIDASFLTGNATLSFAGNAGDDTFVAGRLNPETINGGAGVDTYVIRGTAVRDLLTVSQLAPTGGAGANYRLNVTNGQLLAVPTPTAVQKNIVSINTALTPADENNRPSIEQITLEGLAGDDQFAASHADVYGDNLDNNGIELQTIPIHVIGGSPNAGGDRLLVTDDGTVANTGDLVIHREGPDGRSGSITVGGRIVNPAFGIIGMNPISYEQVERVDIQPLDNVGRTGFQNALGQGSGRLLVFKYDDFETNESMTNATPLGLIPTYFGQRNIDPGSITIPGFPGIPGDADWYEFRPQIASTFRFELLFEPIFPFVPSGRPGLPENGDLRIDVFRGDGTLLSSSAIPFVTPTLINVDRSRFVDVTLDPALTESVFVRVQGISGSLSKSINIYDIIATDIDDLGPQVFDPDGPGGTQQAIFPNNDPTFDLFASKYVDPANPSANPVLVPTPLIFSLTINMRDLPVRAPGDPVPALDVESASQPGMYQVVGDHVGIVDIRAVEVINEPAINFTFNGTVTTAINGTRFRAAGLVGAAQQPRIGDNIIFTSGPAAGELRQITAFNAATGEITVNAAFPGVPAVGNAFTITSFPEAQIKLYFSKPLPDDRFTLTILDGITDPAGNRLDGESDAAEPNIPSFPSGNTVPGGNFVARFTVDSRPEIGSAVPGDIDVDINGNFVWDPANAQIGNDHTNVDVTFTLTVQNGINGPIGKGGYNVNDLPVVGKFYTSGAVPAQLFDQLGAYGIASDLAGSPYRWLIDANGDGVITIAPTSPDRLITQGAIAGFSIQGAIPIAGDFAPGHVGDEIGLYNAGKWALDTNGDYIIDTVITSLPVGTPIVGDFNGDGVDDFGVFNNNTFTFDFSRNGTADLSFVWGFPGVLDRPIAADMDQDGIDDIGLWVPRNSGSVPREVSEWYFLVSGGSLAQVTTVTNTTVFRAANLIGSNKIANGQQVRIRSGLNAGQVRTVTGFNATTGQVTLNSPVTLAVGDVIAIGGGINHAFNPVPFGSDISAEFGDELAFPIVGNFDPPAAPVVFAPAPNVTGDFDNSGEVDDDDYYVWAANYGSAGTTHNAGPANPFNALGYVLWAINNTGSSSSAASSSAAPEEESVAAQTTSSTPVAAVYISQESVDDSSLTTSVGVQEVARSASISVLTTSTSDVFNDNSAGVDGFFATLESSSNAKAKIVSTLKSTAGLQQDDLLLTALAEPTARLDNSHQADDDFASYSDDEEESFDEYMDDLSVLDEVFQVI